MQPPNAPPANPMRNFMIICVLLAAVSIMNANWSNGLTFWGQQANSATRNFTETDIALAKSITAVSDEAALPAILATDRPTILNLYASWCPYCRQQFPIMKALAESHGEKVRIVPLSVDKDARVLAQFLGAKPQPLWFEPVMLAPRDRDQWGAILKEKGITYRGQIPHSIVFDQNGHVIAEFSGVTSADTFLPVLP